MNQQKTQLAAVFPMDLHLGQSVVPTKPGDFEYFRSLCESEQGWQLHLSSDVTVHSRDFPDTTSKCLRVRGRARGVSADVMFDCLCDNEYRESWDTAGAEFYDISRLDRHSSLGYYCLKCPFPFQNRDFVFQRTWGEVSGGYIIMNHSVELPSHPPHPGIVRGTSLITGYCIVDSGDECVGTYLSHSDPKVVLPQWFCDRVGTYLAPGIFRRMYAAVETYQAWKSTHRPEYKPWRHEEQRCLEEYAGIEMLGSWGFPPPPVCLLDKQTLAESDTESFHSADEGETAVDTSV